LQDADSKRSALEEREKKLVEREAKATTREKVSATVRVWQGPIGPGLDV